MLYVIDSPYTDPDSLRRLYLNRRAIADMLPDADPSMLNGGAGAVVVTGGTNIGPIGGPSGSGAGDNGGKEIGGGKVGLDTALQD